MNQDIKVINMPCPEKVHEKTGRKIVSIHMFYLKYCTLLKVMIGLTNQERDVLAEIMFKNYTLIHKIEDKGLRWSYIFSMQSRKEMMEALDMSYSIFNNHLTTFRKLSILKGDRITDGLIVLPESNSFTLQFNFVIP